MKKVLKWILIIFIVLFVLVIAIGACSDPATDDTSASNEAMADMTPQQIDMEMYRPVRSAMASYEDLVEKVNGLDTGETSTLDIYDDCRQIIEWRSGWEDTIDSVTNEETQAYADAAHYYVSNVYMIAQDTVDYINEQDMEKLSSVRDGIQTEPAFMDDVVEARRAYLSNAGLTEEEIQQQFDLG